MRPRRSPSRSPTRRALNFDSPPPRTPSPTRGRRSPTRGRRSPRRGGNRSPEFSSSLESSSESPSDFRLALNFDSPNPQSPLSVNRPLPFIPGRVEAVINRGQSSPYRAPPRRRSPRRSPARESRQRQIQPTQEQIRVIEEEGFLDLSNKGLTEIPSWIQNYAEQIKDLFLMNNKLTFIHPDTFIQLVNLQDLKLSGNEINSLPSNLFDTNTKLEILELHDNRLTSIPPRLFDSLTKLEMLSLDHNRLTTLPPNLFRNNTNLDMLDVGGNPFGPLPLNIFSGIRELNFSGGGNSPSSSPSSPYRSPPRRGDNQNLRELQGEISRFDPRRPPSPQEPREEYEVNCINDDDILMVDDFTKGVKEFENDQRVIILEEGTSKRGNCFGQKTLIMSMMALNNGLPTVGPWEAMNVMGDKAVNRYFKLPYPNVWVDLNGLNNILEGWKVLRLKKIKKERIGSQFAVGTLHGHEEQIYTLSKTNSKYQGKNDRIKFVLDEAEDGNPNIYFKVDDGFLHLFYQ